MTLGDVLALVAGVAASFAIVANLPRHFVRSPSDELVSVAIRSIQGMTLAIAVVVLARIAVYRRMPSVAEWLGILVGSTLLADWPWLQVDAWIYAYRWAFPTLDPLSSIAVRWLAAGLFSVAMAVGLGLLRLGRHLDPAWLKTFVLAWLALLAMSGPFRVFGEHGADLISPSGGFGPGTASTLYRGACGLAAWLPMGILFGLPATAALAERIARRPWTWLEWAAFASSTITGFFSMMLYKGEFAAPTPAWFAERLLVLAWFLAIIFASRWILIRFGGPWCRWVEGPADQVRSSSSVTDSEASIR